MDLADYCGKTITADTEHSGTVFQLGKKIADETCQINLVSNGDLLLGVALKVIHMVFEAVRVLCVLMHM